MTTPLPTLPRPRGPISEAVRAYLLGEASVLPEPWRIARTLTLDWDHDDGQVALWMLLMTEIDVFDSVSPERTRSRRGTALRQLLVDELDAFTRTLAVGASLEVLVEQLAADTAQPHDDEIDEIDERTAVAALCAKAPYLGWEADAHTMALARLPLDLKKPVAEIQAGEYGVGYGSTHAELYRSCLDALGVTLDEAVDAAPAAGFALANTALCFSRRCDGIGAAVGQLLAFELDSVEPCRARVAEWKTTSLPSTGRRWYDVHVLADEEHAEIASETLVPLVLAHDEAFIADVRRGIVATQHVLSRLNAVVRAQPRATVLVEEPDVIVDLTLDLEAPTGAVDDAEPLPTSA